MLVGSDIPVPGLAQEDRTDDHRHHRDDDRVPQPVINVTGRRDHRRRSQRQHPAEPAVADVIRQRHRGVADLGREQFHQERRDRPVHHRHVDQHDDEDHLGHDPVHFALVGAGYKASLLQRGREHLLVTSLGSCTAYGGYHRRAGRTVNALE